MFDLDVAFCFMPVNLFIKMIGLVTVFIPRKTVMNHMKNTKGLGLNIQNFYSTLLSSSYHWYVNISYISIIE